MVKVENKETLRFLTRGFMKMNRSRNIIAVISIILTALIFTSLFTGSVSLILSKRASDIKHFMTSSHASVQDLSAREGEKAEQAIKSNDTIERYGKGIFLGSVFDKRFSFSAEVRYADENLAESFNCVPETGRMPQSADEIAVSSIVLEALDIKPEIGREITVTWEKDPVSEKFQTDTFRLCGCWKGDKAVMSQMIWVSEEYAAKNAYPVTESELKNGIYNGGKDYCVWYKNLWSLSQKTEKLSVEAGFIKKDGGFQVNPAYDLMEEDGFSFASVIVMILFIILAGYLIIYNIFSISVKTDIRAYGLLKNVGATGKQLKKIVRMQAWRLFAIGTPFGLLLGYAAGILMSPSLAADREISAQAGQTAEVVVSANPLIFIAAALLTLLTVYFSTMQACRIVEKVSPVEALRIADGQESYHNKNRSTSATWRGMAVQNVFRNRKKGVIVMLSIALSMVVVNCIAMLVTGYDFDMYKKTLLASDFQMDRISPKLEYTDFNGVTPDIKALLDNCPGSEKTGYVYYSKEAHNMEPSLVKTWESFAEKNEDNWNDYEQQLWEDAKASNKINVHFLGINEAVFDKLEWKGEKCSWDKFKNGDFIIVDFNNRYATEPVSYYQTGDDFKMNYTNGNSKEYKIIGEALMPYSLDYPYADLVYITVIVPENEYISQTGNKCAMYAAIDAKKGADRQIKEYLDDTVLKQNDTLNVFSVLDMKASFQRYIGKYYMIGSFLVVILLFIGVMNFFNTTATSVLSRKRELALLEAVGMTKKQIVAMLIAEGFVYLLGAAVIAILIIVFCAETILSRTFGMAFFFNMKLTVAPCLLMIPLLAVIAYVIPKHRFNKMSRDSIVDRLRTE